jgi:hypothetical protein
MSCKQHEHAPRLACHCEIVVAEAGAPGVAVTFSEGGVDRRAIIRSVVVPPVVPTRDGGFVPESAVVADLFEAPICYDLPGVGYVGFGDHACEEEGRIVGEEGQERKGRSRRAGEEGSRGEEYQTYR